jgi:hypothetical protein
MIKSRRIRKKGGACSKNGRDEKCIQSFRWKTSGEEATWKTQVKTRE